MCLLFASLSCWTDVADLLLRLQFLGQTWVFTLLVEFAFEWQTKTKTACLDCILHILCTACLFVGITKGTPVCCFNTLERGTAMIVHARRFCSAAVFAPSESHKSKADTLSVLYQSSSTWGDRPPASVTDSCLHCTSTSSWHNKNNTFDVGT